MIICRTPMRVSLLGGGTDIPSYYEQHGGDVISLAIKKYTYITLHPKYGDGLRISYSRTENVTRLSNVEHPLVRSVLTESNLNLPLEITSIAEVPSKGTGLGSSSSFTVGLINAISHFLESPRSRSDLAESAWKIESLTSSDGIGKQDQYAVAHGGFNRFQFLESGEVVVGNFNLDIDFQKILLESLYLVDSGISRQASKLLTSQLESYKTSAQSTAARHAIKSSVELGAIALKDCNLQNFAQILSETWEFKKLFGNVSNNEIDSIYRYGLSHGAIGGKLLGAGGGGFFLFIVPKTQQVEFMDGMSRLKKNVLKVELDTEGTSIVYKS